MEVGLELWEVRGVAAEVTAGYRVVLVEPFQEGCRTGCPLQRAQSALRSVQGIYLMAGTKSGQLYVRKADCAKRFLSRWSEYAKPTTAATSLCARHFQFSILQVLPNRTGSPSGRCRGALQEGAADAAVRLEPQLSWPVRRTLEIHPSRLPCFWLAGSTPAVHVELTIRFGGPLLMDVQ